MQVSSMRCCFVSMCSHARLDTNQLPRLRACWSPCSASAVSPYQSSMSHSQAAAPAPSTPQLPCSSCGCCPALLPSCWRQQPAASGGRAPACRIASPGVAPACKGAAEAGGVMGRPCLLQGRCPRRKVVCKARMQAEAACRGGPRCSPAGVILGAGCAAWGVTTAAWLCGGEPLAVKHELARCAVLPRCAAPSPCLRAGDQGGPCTALYDRLVKGPPGIPACSSQGSPCRRPARTSLPCLQAGSAGAPRGLPPALGPAAVASWMGRARSMRPHCPLCGLGGLPCGAARVSLCGACCKAWWSGARRCGLRRQQGRLSEQGCKIGLGPAATRVCGFQPEPFGWGCVSLVHFRTVQYSLHLPFLNPPLHIHHGSQVVMPRTCNIRWFWN